MEPADEETLRFYGENAPAYAKREITSRQVRLRYFLTLPWSSLAIEAGDVMGFDNEWAMMLSVVARKQV